MMKVAEATVKYLISKLGILVCWHNVWNKTKLWLGNLFSDATRLLFVYVSDYQIL